MPLHEEECKGYRYIALYIDDNLILGKMVAIDDAIADLKSKRLMLKIVEGLQDYLSKRAWLGQPYLIKNREEIWQAHA